MSSNIPFIPSTAPFTPAQRAWLNGYFVGLLSNAHSGEAAPPTESKPSEPLLIGFGSQTGTAEGLAKRIAKESAKHGYGAQVKELNAIKLEDLAAAKRLLIITSTWGDGEAPDNAADFWNALKADSAPRLSNLSFSVLALGDRNYSDFCGAGRKMDERLEKLGARRLLARVDCDVDYEKTANGWIEKIWDALSAKPASWSKSNPYPSRLISNRVLNGAGSAKETRHLEFTLEGSGLAYEPGDALGVLARNCPELVAEFLALGEWKELEEALLTRLDLRKPTSALLDALAKTEGCETFSDLLTPEKKPALQAYLYEREVIDLLIEFPRFRPSAAEFEKMLGKLQPRLYSISSSPRAFPDQVHLTVAIVRYETRNRKRKGLCSTFLADRAAESVPIFFQPSHGFRLPKDPATPIIMVGPGTGIAPFRAFLHDRQATGAKGKNWLFFGDQRSSSDFLYREELETFKRDGLLARLDTAFSRDQREKIYVQDRMRESAAELWRWLEEGAHFYVCGDAKRMAKDVDAALHKVIEAGGKSSEEAAAYVKNLKEQKRYQRDVY
jgi:sulfite reductase (NADPH) flavoprotein alpha-component